MGYRGREPKQAAVIIVFNRSAGGIGIPFRLPYWFK